MKAIAIIPARMNSKRFPGKNMAMLGGKPMLVYSIEAAEQSMVFDAIYVDYMDINPADVIFCSMIPSVVNFMPRADILRPYKTTTDDIIQWYLDTIEAECYCFLQPTNPLRTAKHIQECYELFKEYDKNVISVNRYTYEPNGAIYMNKPGILPYDGNPSLYLMSPTTGIHIDYKYQLKIAEGILNGDQIPTLETSYYPL